MEWKANISILILTFNEARNLKQLLSSLGWCDDVVVLDSFSTDDTRSVATSFQNVRWYEHRFNDYSSQRNYGLHSVDYKHDWVLMLDADEICPLPLAQEISQKTQNVLPCMDVFLVKRKDFFQGKWMRCHYPVWFERVVRPANVSFKGMVHEKLDYQGNSSRLQNDLHHFPFANGIDRWIERHNQYSTQMALDEAHPEKIPPLRELLSHDPIQRNRVIKAVYVRFPGRWMFYFLHRYFVKGAIFDGLAGLEFVLLETWYHFSVVAKIREIRRGAVLRDEELSE